MTIVRSKMAILLAQAIPDPDYGNAAGLLSAACIAASLGLAFGARWARHLSQALLQGIMAAWCWVLITFSIPNWPFTDVWSSIFALLPGAVFVTVCLGVFAALRRHFRSYAV